MHALVLFVNGKKLATAGVGSRGVLAANVTWVGRLEGGPRSKGRVPNDRVGVVLGGLDSTTDEHLEWRQRSLRIGDEVCIRVIDAESVDRPRRRTRRNRTQELREKERYVREMAKKLGWTIESRRRSRGSA